MLQGGGQQNPKTQHKKGRWHSNFCQKKWAKSSLNQFYLNTNRQNSGLCLQDKQGNTKTRQFEIFWNYAISCKKITLFWNSTTIAGGFWGEISAPLGAALMTLFTETAQGDASFHYSWINSGLVFSPYRHIPAQSPYVRVLAAPRLSGNPPSLKLQPFYPEQHRF